MTTPVNRDECNVGSGEIPAYSTLVLQTSDDYSAAFHKIRAGLTSDTGQAYVEFVRGLRPDYPRVYRDIGFGYGMLIATALVAGYMLRLQMPVFAVAAAAALSFGYWFAYLQLFLHEAAHFNLAANRKISDRLGNVLIAWCVGTTVASYRKVHFEHHRALGTTKDTESSYFLALNTLYLVQSLCGWRAIKVILMRKRSVQELRGAIIKDGESQRALGPIVRGVIGHAVVFGILSWVGSWPLALAWGFGVGVVFPFFAALRPVLEHRSETACGGIDYCHVNHGAYTRLFGDDALAATFGGAGFNRHLLHHWEPQVSYTRLPHLEQFLANTPVKTIMESRRASYVAAFWKLFTFY